MKAAIALLVLLLGVWTLPAHAVLCGDTCTSNGDCTSDCPFCDLGFTDSCIDCCVMGDSVSCTTNYGCTWDVGSSQCRNFSAVECNAAVPEVPASMVPTLFLGFGLLIFVFFSRPRQSLWWRRK